jgi:hypothetical protein
MASQDHKSTNSFSSNKYKRKLKKYSNLSGTEDDEKTLAPEEETSTKSETEERPSLGKILETTMFVAASAIGGGAASAVFGKLSPLIGIAAISAGAYYNNIYLMAGGSGLLLIPTKYKEAEAAEQQHGYFSISAVGKRLEGYMNFWQDKIMPEPEKKAQQLPPSTPEVPAIIPAQQSETKPQATAPPPPQKPLEHIQNPIMEPTQAMKQNIAQPPKEQKPLTFLNDDIAGLNL